MISIEMGIDLVSRKNRILKSLNVNDEIIQHSYDDRSWAQPHQQASNYDSAQFGGQYEGNPNEEDAQENGNDMEIGQWNPNGGPGDHAAQRFGGGRGGRPRGSRGRGRGDFYRGGGGGGGGNGGGGGRGFRGGNFKIIN